MRRVLLWFSLIGWGWAQPLHLAFEVSETVTPEKGKPKVTTYPLVFGLGARHLYCADRKEKVWMTLIGPESLSCPASTLRSFPWSVSVGRNRWRHVGGLHEYIIADAPR